MVARPNRPHLAVAISFDGHHYGSIFTESDADLAALADWLGRQAADPDNPLTPWQSWVIIRLCRSVAEKHRMEKFRREGLERLLRDVLATEPDEEAMAAAEAMENWGGPQKSP